MPTSAASDPGHDATILVAVDHTMSELPGDLPAALTSLVGRDAELATLAHLLHQPALRLLTLTGPGGVGKTRLAIAAALAHRAATGMAAWYVPLAPVNDPDLVPSTIAQTLEVRETPGQSALDAVANALAPRPALLVLDNLEHLPAVATLATDLLERCPSLTILATSRIRLRVTGEHEFPVPPLATGAETLFIDRARAVQPTLAVTPESMATITEICLRLDGLPLAIELAAARTKILSPPALLARLSNRFQVLAGGPQDAPDRHQTMQAAVAWSYDLLSPTNQAVFRRLSVFAGGASLDAIEAVAGGRREDGNPGSVEPAGEGLVSQPFFPSSRLPVFPSVSSSPSILDSIMSLFDHALIRREDGPDDEPRFLMLETIRAFAADLLDAHGETAPTRQAHAEYVAGLAARMSAHRLSPDKGRWFDRIDADVDNLRAALTWAIDTRDAGLALRIAGEVANYWMTRGLIREGIAWLSACTALPGGDGRYRAMALRWLGLHERMAGHAHQAELHLTEALTQARLASDAELEVRSLMNLGILAGDRSDYARNRDLLEEALHIAVAAGDVHGEAFVLQNLAVVAERTGDSDASHELEIRSLERFREGGDSFSVAIGLINRGGYYYRKGEFAPAIAYLEEALATFRALGDRTYATIALVRVAEFHRYRRAFPQAIAAYREALQDQIALGMSQENAALLMTIMTVVHDLGRPTLAARVAGAADAAGDWRVNRVTPEDVVEFENYLNRIRKTLGNPAYDAAWAAGRAQPLAALVDDLRALEPSDGAPASVPKVDPAAAARALGLTPREHEIVTLLAEGLTDREIADRLFISRKTASNHVTAVLAKLDLATRSAVGVFAIRHGLLSTQLTS